MTAGPSSRSFRYGPASPPGSENWTQKEGTQDFQPDGGRDLTRAQCHSAHAHSFSAEPSTANGTAVIVCPGGGFYFLSWESEGTEVAEWLSAHGIAAFVLKYRLIDTGPTEEDFRQAVAVLFSAIAKPQWPFRADAQGHASGHCGRPASDEVVRQRASEWGIAPDRIGLMGFSAGGVVTMGVVTDSTTPAAVRISPHLFMAPASAKAK